MTFANMTPADVPANTAQLARAIECALYRDRGRLSRQLAEIGKRHAAGQDCAQQSQRLLLGLRESCAGASRRAAMSPVIEYPAALPISDHIEHLRDTIDRHQVVIVAGETGSGKTTQLPKICLQLGRGIYGRIGHTQPRRLAARTVAARIAEELQVVPGQLVGFQHRFSEQFGADTRVKVMTDGVLLANLHNDRGLREYDTIIIDEAHERSLNIDFLLGVLKTLLPKRAELKLIVTSATIDVDRFASYFSGAPIVEIPGRSYPVAIEYIAGAQADQSSVQPTSDTRARAGGDKNSAVETALDDLNGRLLAALDSIEANAATETSSARDVLVFLPGEREIRDASKALRATGERYEVLPLYARLSVAEQQRIFSTRGRRTAGVQRRVVLATNVAETSITVPGIGYVIDSGLARVSRYSARSKLQRLQVEAVSQASAAQRAGRSGRVAPGVCYRLYGEDDFDQRPAYTEPEILRTQLAAVILQMKRLELGDIAQFPFLEAPAPRQVTAGQKTLAELGALNQRGELSKIGQQLAVLPLDPRLGRMLLAGLNKRCSAEMLVIVSALAVQDPRENPAAVRQAAQAVHSRFEHPRSDFIAWLKLWDYYENLRQELGQRRLRKRCEVEYLSYMRMREWRDMHRQLRLAMRPLARQQNVPLASSVSWFAEPDEDFPFEQIHCAILSGIPLQIGTLDERDKVNSTASNKDAKRRKPLAKYLAPRNLSFYLFPGSSQFKRSPRWVMAGEIVETTKVYARSVAAIEPDWIAAELPHLLKYHYAEPYWHAKRGQVVAQRSTLFFGLTLHSAQLVGYSVVDPAASRQLFIQAALVEEQLKPDAQLLKRATFWQHNRDVIERIREREAKLRRRDLLLQDADLHAFYERNVPAHITSRAELAAWLQECPEEQSRALLLSEEQAQAQQTPFAALEQFPTRLELGGQVLDLSYCFAPGSADDGVTARIPHTAVATLSLPALEWLVPGMLIDKCAELIKILPKAQRKKLVPAPQVASALSANLAIRDCMQQSRSLYVELAQQIRIHHAVAIDPVEWRNLARARLADYYKLRVEIVSADGAISYAGRDIPAIQRECLQGMSARAKELEQRADDSSAVTAWTFGSLDVDTDRLGSSAGGFKALKQQANDLVLGYSVTVEDADTHTRQNLPQLAMLVMPDKVRYLKKSLCKDASKILPYVQIGDREQLVDDLIKAAVAHSCFADFASGIPRSDTAFTRCIEAGRNDLLAVAVEMEQLVYALLSYYQRVCAQLREKRGHFPVQCTDIEEQLAGLVYAGFLQRCGFARLQHLPRYLEAVLLRLDRLGGRAEKDGELCEKLSSLQRPLHNLLYKYPHAIVYDEQVREFRWLLEELRVSLFAQHLKTVVPVSLQRVSKAWQTIDLNHYPLIQ